VLCDLRIAADDARFGIRRRDGLGYRASSMKNLVDTVGAPYGARDHAHRAPVQRRGSKGMGLSTRFVPVPTWKRPSPSTPRPSLATRRSRCARQGIIREVVTNEYDAAKCKAWVKECFESEIPGRQEGLRGKEKARLQGSMSMRLHLHPEFFLWGSVFAQPSFPPADQHGGRLRARGGTDTVAHRRQVPRRQHRPAGRVENRAGAGGNIAVDYTVKSQPTATRWCSPTSAR